MQPDSTARGSMSTNARPARLNLADNVADALLAVGDAGQVSDAEALRVVRPLGKVLLGRQRADQAAAGRKR